MAIETKYQLEGYTEYDIQGPDIFVWAQSVSDGHHTMNELYEHRHTLFCALLKIYDNYITPLGTDRVKCWKSKLHHDGTMFEGWFIAGMTVTTRSLYADIPPVVKQITYHLPFVWWDRFNVIDLPTAPVWDGHDSNEVLKRIMEL